MKNTKKKKPKKIKKCKCPNPKITAHLDIDVCQYCDLEITNNHFQIIN